MAEDEAAPAALIRQAELHFQRPRELAGYHEQATEEDLRTGAEDRHAIDDRLIIGAIHYSQRVAVVADVGVHFQSLPQPRRELNRLRQPRVEKAASGDSP